MQQYWKRFYKSMEQEVALRGHMAWYGHIKSNKIIHLVENLRIVIFLSQSFQTHISLSCRGNTHTHAHVYTPTHVHTCISCKEGTVFLRVGHFLSTYIFTSYCHCWKQMFLFLQQIQSLEMKTREFDSRESKSKLNFSNELDAIKYNTFYIDQYFSH